MTDYQGTVPDNTIKKGYDVYKDIDYKNIASLGDYYGGGDNGGVQCGHKNTLGMKIFMADDKQHNGQHRRMSCRQGLKIAHPSSDGYDCGDCDFWPQSTDGGAGPGFISSYKVPIGLYLNSGTGNAGTNSQESSVNCDASGNKIGWNYGDYSNNSKWPSKVPDDVAVGCSGGSSLKPGTYSKTINNFKVYHDNRDTTKDPLVTPDEECWLGPKDIANNDSVVCLKSGVDWPTFCQLGDNAIAEASCIGKCKNVADATKLPEYCKYAMNRLCKIKQGEPVKRHPLTGEIVYSDGNKIISESKCWDYCGSPGDNKCLEVKNDICSSADEFLKHDSWIPEYCKGFWKGIPNVPKMSETCRSAMLDPTSGQTIFSGKGCSKMCPGGGNDVDKDWCDSVRAEFCTKNNENMLSENCYQFCNTIGNEHHCTGYLLGSNGDNGMCAGINDEDKLNESVPGTIRQWADWCGCMMPSKYYQDHIEKVQQLIKEQGYVINGIIDTKPECIYPNCKSGSIKTISQRSRINNGECKGCVQALMINATDSNISDSNFAQTQSLNCTNNEITTSTENSETNNNTQNDTPNDTSDDTSDETSEAVQVVVAKYFNELPARLESEDPSAIGEVIGYVFLGIAVVALLLLLIRYLFSKSH